MNPSTDDELQLPLSNDHNVYILGAGFSASAGLPVMSEFLNRMRDAMDWLTGEGRSSEAEAIQKVLRYRLDAASAAYWMNLDLENVEQLFSLASVTQDDHRVNELLPLAIAATLDFCRECGADKRAHIQPCEQDSIKRFRSNPGDSASAWTKHAPVVFRRIEDAGNEGRMTFNVAALLGMLNQSSTPTGKNTFITFNYDTLVEDALTRLGLPWSYGLSANSVNFPTTRKDQWGKSDDSNAIHVLKLHGSENWGRKPTGKRIEARLAIYRSYKELSGAAAIPRLIPPSWSKSVEDQISSVWAGATKQLQTATRIILIGFSMPETDLHFRYLLAAGLKRNVSLRSIVFVNLDPVPVAQRAKSILRASYIDQNLIQFVPADASNYASSIAEGRSLPNTQSKDAVDIGRTPEGPYRCHVFRR